MGSRDRLQARIIIWTFKAFPIPATDAYSTKFEDTLNSHCLGAYPLRERDSVFEGSKGTRRAPTKVSASRYLLDWTH